MGRIITELNERSRDVLRCIIDSYLETGDPVGSRTLARQIERSLSPATIRNVMADLQDAGLLFSPHTSAGRLPTEAGLRLFVDGLLEVGRLSEGERQTIESQCGAAGKSVEQVLTQASDMLSGLSNCAGVVAVPQQETRLKHIEFVNLSPGRALVVMVTDSGQVENRIMEVPTGLPASALIEATNYLSARLIGNTLGEARREIELELEAHKAQLDAATQRLVEAGLATWSGETEPDRALIVSGTGRLLEDVTALDELERVRALFGALETQEGLLALIDATMDAPGVQIYIGAEDELFGIAGCSMVVAPYTNSREQIVGAIGVIGPTRINYARIIPVVDYTAKIVGRLLT